MGAGNRLASALSRFLNGGSGGGAKAAFAARGASIARFYDVEKHGTGDGSGGFDWFSYGKTQLHGHFDAADDMSSVIKCMIPRLVPPLAGYPQ